MKVATSWTWPGFLSVIIILGLGCERHSGPPAPFGASQIPAELELAFKDAPPEIKKLADQTCSALQNKDYPAALHFVRSLGRRAEETAEQRVVAARALLGVYELLRVAAAQGDQKAAALVPN